MTETQALAVRELPEPVARRGITEAQWLTLCNSLYPGANPKSVLLVVDYCAARHLDAMKKPVHIVPMEVKVGDEYQWRDVVMPGIYEYRITAHRTGDYLGHDKPTYGSDKEIVGVTAPEWCEFTVYRWNTKAGMKVPFTVRVFFAEVVATRKDRQTQKVRANGRWTRAPIQMLTKCAEAAALREAFPEEIGGEPTMEEMEGRAIDVTPQVEEVPPANPVERIPEGFRDNVEKAFTALSMSEAQRLAKINEFLGKPDVTPEDATQALLEWCRDEFSKRKTGQPRKADNAKRRQNAAPAAPASQVAAPPHVDPSGGESDARGSGPEVPAEAQKTTPPAPAKTEALASDELRWGSETF